MKLSESVENKIREIVDEIVPEAFLVEIEIHRSKVSVLRIILDTPEGVGLQQCTSVSRKVSRMLDEGELLDFRYNLEVTSPGLDRPLKVLKQYEKNVGRKLKVWLSDDSRIKGKLTDVQEEEITLEPEVSKKQLKKDPSLGEPVTIKFDNIKEAKVLVSFS